MRKSRRKESTSMRRFSIDKDGAVGAALPAAPPTLQSQSSTRSPRNLGIQPTVPMLSSSPKRRSACTSNSAFSEADGLLSKSTSSRRFAALPIRSTVKPTTIPLGWKPTRSSRLSRSTILAWKNSKLPLPLSGVTRFGSLGLPSRYKVAKKLSSGRLSAVVTK